MIFYKQLHLHRPDEGSYGDCYRTAIGCLLDLEPGDVPHFAVGNTHPSEFHERTQAWLAERGLIAINIPYAGELNDVLESAGKCNPGLPFILGCSNARGVDHNVVAQDGLVVHDPSLEPAPPYGPMSDGHYWLMYIGKKL